jgi:hypothetical protein
MNNADIIVHIPGGSNVNGKCVIEDMFNPSDFEGEPKRDVDIGGVNNVKAEGCAVVDGWTSASWRRNLHTGDNKTDWDITDIAGYARVIIAHGVADSTGFGYHGFGNTGTCKLNLFNGSLAEPCRVFWS